MRNKRKMSPSEDSEHTHQKGANLMKERTGLMIAEKKLEEPLSFSQYQAAWHAFQENPSILHVSKSVGISKSLAMTAIEEGWPKRDMPSLSSRLSEVRKAAIAKSNYDATVAMEENARFARSVKARLAKELGPGFKNLSFKKGAFENLTIAQFNKFTKALDTLFRLEASMAQGNNAQLAEVDDGKSSDGELSKLLQSVLRSRDTKNDSARDVILEAEVVER